MADEEMSDEDTKKAKRAERLMAIHAHMEHEFDSVSVSGVSLGVYLPCRLVVLLF